jgi:hypothetical protein
MICFTEGGGVYGRNPIVSNIKQIYCNVSMISESDRHQLKKMIEAHGVEDHTEKIRLNNHSSEIRRCIQHIVKVKETVTENIEEEVLKEAGFLFVHYFDIYNLVLKQRDVSLLLELINILERIEKGELDQHEGSYLVGKLLKGIYIDTVIQNSGSDKPVPKREPKPVSWTEYKAMRTS